MLNKMVWQVLVVDSDETVGNGLAAADADINVTRASRIGDALNLTGTSRFDVLVCDRDLLDGDGLVLVRLARTEAETANVPIVVLSERFDQLDVAEVLSAGADDYLAKPIETGRLMASIAKAITRHRDSGAVRRGSAEVALAALPPAPDHARAPSMIDTAGPARTDLQQQLQSAVLERAHLEHEVQSLRSKLERSADEASRLAYEVDQLQERVRELEAKLSAAEAIDLRDSARRLYHRVSDKAKGSFRTP
jgi:two-component system phosphate regulon response regulator PhoB